MQEHGLDARGELIGDGVKYERDGLKENGILKGLCFEFQKEIGQRKE
jgi:hypothetical protein